MEIPSMFLEQRAGVTYPDNKDLYAPSVRYPEFPFPATAISEAPNEVYDMVRACMHGLNLDTANYGTPQWNPLGEYIRPGDTVLVKPNWVKECVSEEKWNCTITHASVLRAITDYCIIAKAGTIIWGDAPIQGASIELVWEHGRYGELQEFYAKQCGANILLSDLRDLVVRVVHGVYIPYHNPDIMGPQGLVTVQMGANSYHAKVPEDVVYETCGYPDTEINQMHNTQSHSYVIAADALQANVIINIPKPKTHRYAGLTGAQKNFIGASPNKESLPHFKRGAPKNGGDETNKDSAAFRLTSYLYRTSISHSRKMHYLRSYFFRVLYRIMRRLEVKERYLIGAWHGNDTIWRTILDVNRILLYADASGKLDFSRPVRTILTFGDMIIAGECAGPLDPSPKPLGAILASTNCAAFDLIFCNIMGFAKEVIPTVKNAEQDLLLLSCKANDIILGSNLAMLDGVSLEKIKFPPEWHFKPHPYWDEILNTD